MKISPKIASLALAFAISASTYATAAHANEAAQAQAGFRPDRAHTAVLITDPQNDFMSEKGAAWGLVKDNVLRLRTRENIAALVGAAKASNMDLFVSPHFYFGADNGWLARGPIQQTMHDIGMFKVDGPTAYNGFEGSGSDFYAPLKASILDGRTIITSPHKIYGPESNDLVLQLRKRGINTVILGGFAANLCTDSHMRELMEEGFNVIVVKDAVGAPGEDAYNAAMLNASMIANAVWTTAEAVSFIK